MAIGANLKHSVIKLNFLDIMPILLEGLGEEILAKKLRLLFSRYYM